MQVVLLNDSTVSTFGEMEVNTVALSIIQKSTISAGDATIEISLASFLFGE